MNPLKKNKTIASFVAASLCLLMVNFNMAQKSRIIPLPAVPTDNSYPLYWPLYELEERQGSIIPSDVTEAFGVEPVEKFEVADEVGVRPPGIMDGVYVSEEEFIEEEIVREEHEKTLNYENTLAWHLRGSLDWFLLDSTMSCLGLHVFVRISNCVYYECVSVLLCCEIISY